MGDKKYYRLDFYKDGRPVLVIGSAEEDEGITYFDCAFFKESGGGETINHQDGTPLRRYRGAFGEKTFLRFFGGVCKKVEVTA